MLATGTVPSPWPVVAYDTASIFTKCIVGVMLGKAKHSPFLDRHRYSHSPV